ncbi:TPA: hypothetical protein L9B29_005378, partial [Klebsiella quasipneumoniae]|nr:hypothetical protein [Klebsiella quasipneumoniae]
SMYEVESDDSVWEILNQSDDPVEEIAKALKLLGNPNVELEWDADGEPNFYTLLRNGKWFAKVQLNGEMSTGQQEAFLSTFATKHERKPNA